MNQQFRLKLKKQSIKTYYNIYKKYKMNNKKQNKINQEEDDAQIDEEAILVQWNSSNSSKRSAQQDLQSISDKDQGQNYNQKQTDNSHQNEDDDKMLEINQTIDFDDDLAQSIRQENIKPKHFQKSKNHLNSKEMDKYKSKPNQIHRKINKSEVQIELQESSYSKQEEQNSSQNSFSKLNQRSKGKFNDFDSKISDKSFGDLNEQKDSFIRYGTFSGLNQKQDEFKSVQNYSVGSNDQTMEPTAFSKLNKQNQRGSFQGDQIFGQLLVPQKSNLIANYKKQSPVFNMNEKVSNLNISLITEKVSQSSPKKNEKIGVSPQGERDERGFSQQKNGQYVNLEQSYYMQPDSVKEGQKVKKKQLDQVRIICKDSTYFVEYKDSTLTVSNQLIKRIMEMFLQKNIMLPLFNQQILQAWKVQDNDQFSEFNLYIRQYFQFLSRKYGDNLKKIVKQLSVTKKERSVAHISKEDDKKSYAQMLKQFFKKTSYSKPEMLKKTLQSKLACIQIINDFPILDQPLNQQSQKTKQLKQQIKSLKRRICSLQLLINFQKSELFCNKKLEEKLQQNIWKKRKDRVICDKNWYISNIFNSILI